MGGEGGPFGFALCRVEVVRLAFIAEEFEVQYTLVKLAAHSPTLLDQRHVLVIGVVLCHDFI